MHSSCESVRSLLPHFVKAQLDEHDTFVVVNHIADCDHCTREEIDLRRLCLLLQEWKEEPVSQSLMDQIKQVAVPHIARLPGLSAGASTHTHQAWTWKERWQSLLDATLVARRRMAPFAFATVASATLFALLVLLKEPTRASQIAAIFLAGVWCSSVANGLIGLASGEHSVSKDEKQMAQHGHRLEIDLHATAVSAAFAGGFVATLFVIAGVVPIQQIVRSLAQAAHIGLSGDLLRIAMYCVASFLTVSAAVAAPPRMRIGHGRISGTLVALIYSAIAAPLIYVAVGFRLDSLWLVGTSATFLFALIGGLVGDFFVLKQDGVWSR